jgi:hypothetical protein
VRLHKSNKAARSNGLVVAFVISSGLTSVVLVAAALLAAIVLVLLILVVLVGHNLNYPL